MKMRNVTSMDRRCFLKQFSLLWFLQYYFEINRIIFHEASRTTRNNDSVHWKACTKCADLSYSENVSVNFVCLAKTHSYCMTDVWSRMLVFLSATVKSKTRQSIPRFPVGEGSFNVTIDVNLLVVRRWKCAVWLFFVVAGFFTWLSWL